MRAILVTASLLCAGPAIADDGAMLASDWQQSGHHLMDKTYRLDSPVVLCGSRDGKFDRVNFDLSGAVVPKGGYAVVIDAAGFDWNQGWITWDGHLDNPLAARAGSFQSNSDNGFITVFVPFDGWPPPGVLTITDALCPKVTS